MKPQVFTVPDNASRGNDQLGASPRNGDFARLLEAASTPASHRLGIGPAVPGHVLARRPMLERTIRPLPVADGKSPESALQVWLSRSLRDRVVGVLIGMAALWIVLQIALAIVASGDAGGALMIAALAGFFAVRAWRNARRSAAAGARSEPTR